MGNRLRSLNGAVSNHVSRSTQPGHPSVGHCNVYNPTLKTGSKTDTIFRCTIATMR